MRDGLRQVGLRDRPWRMVVVASVLAAAIVVGVFAAFSSSAPASPPSSASHPIDGEPPPQAPVSAPEPTLVALDVVQPTPLATSEPSPFAGIANAPAAGPGRTAIVHHSVP